MTDPQSDVGTLDHVWRKFCAQLAEAGDVLARPSTPTTALDQAEGLRYLSRLARTALNMLVDSADPDFPRLFLLCDDKIKIGADNPDNLYQQCVVRGDRTYRITGKRNSVPYFSIGSKANRYAIDGTMASTGELQKEAFGADASGDFTIIASATRPEGDVPWLPLAPDSNILQVRQTFLHRPAETPARFAIERISQGPAFPPPTDPQAIERRMMAAGDFVVNATRMFANWTAMFMPYPNEMRDWGQDMFHKAGGDPAIFYVHGYWKLAPDERLVIETKVPDCEHWNIQVDNWWMESLDYRYLPACINAGNAVREADGSVRIVLSATDPGEPNWLTTHGHGEGHLLLRWVRAASHPIPRLRVERV